MQGVAGFFGAELLVFSGQRPDASQPRASEERAPPWDLPDKLEQAPTGRDKPRFNPTRIVHPSRRPEGQEEPPDHLRREMFVRFATWQWRKVFVDCIGVRLGEGKENTAMSEISKFGRRYDREFKEKAIALVLGVLKLFLYTVL